MLCYVMIAACWAVWKVRNDKIFRGSNSSPSAVMALAANCYLQNSSRVSGSSRTSSSTPPATIKWQAPARNYFKLNFDGSVTNNSAACGFVIRDENGRPVFAATCSAGLSSVPVAEATALRNGLLDAKCKGIRRLEVEGDSKLVIDSVNRRSAIPWRLRMIVADIHSILQAFETVSFKHIFREANFVADAIAGLGHLQGHVNWCNAVPKEASPALLFDLISAGCPRGFSL